MPGDISYASVSLLLHGDGADASTVFTDSGPLALTPNSVGGSIAIATAQSKFGGSSLNCRRTGELIYNNAGFAFGTGDFTVEGFLYFNTASGASQYGPFQISTSAGYSTDTTSSLSLFAMTGGVWAISAGGAVRTSAVTITTGVQHHFAISRVSGVTKLFVNGTQALSFTDTQNYSGNYAVIGGYYSTAYRFDGYIDDLRVTKGVGRYAADFTPPTEAFPDAPADVESVIAAPAVLGAPSVFGAAQVAAWSAAPAVLGVPSVYGAQSAAWAAVPAVLGTPYAMGSVPLIARAAAASPLGAALAKAFHDFSALLGDTVTHYVMDLTTPGGTVRVPISSWQATLQTGASCYVQCVIPACLDWSAAINAADEFVVSRIADAPTAQIEYEMARSPIGQVSMARGPINFTATLSGYAPAFAEDEDPPETYDRTLADVRSVTTGTSPTRVRCAIDWLLRPGQRAYYGDGASFVVRYINYYVPATGDAYMDVGE